MKPKDTEKGLTADRLREVIRYEPETGRLFWLKGNNQNKIGDEAGWLTRHGYLRITVFGNRYMAHRLAWLYMTGEWPPEKIDHINTDRLDNRWVNLRSATDGQNSANQKISKINMLGVKGVRLHKCGKYIARICKDRRQMYLGVFDTLEAAKAAYGAKAKELFGEFARADS